MESLTFHRSVPRLPSIVVDLGLTDEQEQLVASFEALFAKAASPERVRAAEASGVDDDLWRELTEVGAVAMAVPEEAGGWGADLVDLTLVAELAGRAAAPAPLVEAQVAARALAVSESAAARDELAARLDDGAVATIAVRPLVAGTAPLTPAGAVGRSLLAFDGDRLLLAPVDDAWRAPVANLASAPLADLVVGDDAVVLRDGPAARHRFEAAVDEWLILTAALVVGSGAAALDLGCAYAAEREAFGRRIGSFQAMSHPLADAATELDGARLLVREAAWAVDAGDRRSRELAAMAFAFASEASARATEHALHVHGGYGFMLEYDVQLHFRRARGWPRVWGDAEAAYQRAADARYGPTGEGHR